MFPKLLQDVVEAGVSLVVLRDGLTINRDSLQNDVGTWYRLLGAIHGAHDFSKKLSDRVSSAKKKEKEEIARGVKRRKNVVPFWIRWSDEANDFVIIEREAILIRRIFEMAIERGYGCARIARILREENTLTATGKSFTTGTIHKLVTNVAVKGFYQPTTTAEVTVTEAGQQVVRRRQVPDGAPVQRYPAVIDAERFELAQEKLRGRTKKGGARTMFRSPLQGQIRCHHSGELMAYTQSIRGKNLLYEYLRPGHAAKATFAEKGSGRLINYQSVLAAVLTGLGQTTWEAFFSDADSEDELQRELARLNELEDGLIGMKAQHQNLKKAVGDAAERGEFDLLTTLQDRATEKQMDIEEREATLSRTKARVAELRSNPMAEAWPQLREQIHELMKVFGRGHDTEADRGRLNGLLVSHGIQISIDTVANRIGFTVNDRTQWQSYDPDQVVVQLWSGIIQNMATPSELEFRKQQLADAEAFHLDVPPKPSDDAPLAEREAWAAQAKAVLEAAEADNPIKRLVEHVDRVGVLYEGDIAARAKEIRATVSRNRMNNRTN